MASTVRNALLVLALLTLSCPGHADLLGENGGLYRIDSATGEIFFIDSTSSGGNSLAQDASGQLYTAIGYPGGIRTLERLNLESNQYDPVCYLTTDDPELNKPGLFLAVRAMAFDGLDTLYLVVDGEASPPSFEDSRDILLKTTLDSCALDTIGRIQDFTAVAGLDFAPDGRLFAWDVFRGLLSIDPDTAIAADIDGMRTELDIQSIAFDDNGEFYGVRNNLYRIDSATGAVQLVGREYPRDSFDMRGLGVWPGSIDIDIRPFRGKKAPNIINLKKNKPFDLPVAIYGSESFDVLQLETASIRLARAKPSQSRPLDVNRDGYLDLVVEFRLNSNAVQCGATALTLTARTAEAETVSGIDSIKTVACKLK